MAAISQANARSSKKTEDLSILNCEAYESTYLKVYMKFQSILHTSILDKDDVLNICRETYFTSRHDYDNTKGVFAGFLYRSCIRRVYREINTQKSGIRVTYYTVEKELAQSLEHKTSILTNEEYLRAESKPFETLKLVDILEEEVTVTPLVDDSLLDVISTSLTGLEEKILDLKLKGYKASEIGSLLGVTEKYIYKKWSNLKKKLRQVVETYDSDLR